LKRWFEKINMQIKNFDDIKSIFFDNLTIKQTIFKNTFWLAIAEGVEKLAGLILLIYVARIFGATRYGEFSFALAFIGLFSIFWSFGLPRIIVRELSQREEWGKEFSAIFSLRIVLSIITLILILIGSFFVTPDPLTRKIIWILAVYTLFDNFAGFINFFFQAKQKMEYESWTRILRALLLTGFGFFVIFNFPSVKNLSYGYLFAGLIAFIIIMIFFHFKVYRVSFSFNKSLWKKYLKMSWPIALAGFFSIIYGQIDSVIMGYLKQITETGWYNAAYRIAGAAFIPISLISIPFYPVLSKAFKESQEKFQKVWDNQLEIMILLAFPVIVGGIILAPKIIDFVYDPSYTSSILALQILIIMAGISFLHNPFNQALIVFNQQTKFFWISLSGAIINIILNLLLIPKYSLYGAAMATVITAFVVLLIYIRFTLRFTSIKLLNLKFIWIGLLAIFSTIIMYLVISNHIIYNLHAIFSTIIGTATYFITFFILRFIIKNVGTTQLPF